MTNKQFKILQYNIRKITNFKFEKRNQEKRFLSAVI